jgi:hypothetical protein
MQSEWLATYRLIWLRPNCAAYTPNSVSGWRPPPRLFPSSTKFRYPAAKGPSLHDITVPLTTRLHARCSCCCRRAGKWRVFSRNAPSVPHARRVYRRRSQDGGLDRDRNEGPSLRGANRAGAVGVLGGHRHRCLEHGGLRLLHRPDASICLYFSKLRRNRRHHGTATDTVGQGSGG